MKSNSLDVAGKQEEVRMIYKKHVDNHIQSNDIGKFIECLFLISSWCSRKSKGLTRVDKPAEYKSPPAKRPNMKQPNEGQQAKKMSLKSLTQMNSAANIVPIPTEPVKVLELSNMSSKELADHVEGLRNTVRRLQEAECSFVREVEEETNEEVG